MSVKINLLPVASDWPSIGVADAESVNDAIRLEFTAKSSAKGERRSRAQAPGGHDRRDPPAELHCMPPFASTVAMRSGCSRWTA